jgi:hypothetical protein
VGFSTRVRSCFHFSSHAFHAFLLVQHPTSEPVSFRHLLIHQNASQRVPSTMCALKGDFRQVCGLRAITRFIPAFPPAFNVEAAWYASNAISSAYIYDSPFPPPLAFETLRIRTLLLDYCTPTSNGLSATYPSATA